MRVEAPPQVVYQRLTTRQEGDSPENSDADWAVYQRMKNTLEKMHRNHYAVDTSRDISPVLEKVVREAGHQV